MSIYDRDYIRDEQRRPRGAGPATWSVVIWLIVINLGVYVVNNLLFFNPQRDILGLSLEALQSWRLWTPLTYQFVHANLWHLLANLLGLFFLGRMLLEWVPPGKVVRIYLLGGLVGGAFQLVWNAAFGDAIVVGASGSVLAITLAVTTLVPFHRIQLLLFFILPVTLTMRQLAWALVAINALTLVFGIGIGTGGGADVAVMAHFGGMALGWAYVKLGWHGQPRISRPSAKRNRGVLGRAIGGDTRSAPSGKKSTTGKKTPFVASDVDAILDKINDHGFQSLTEDERRTLEESSQRLSRRIDRDS